MMIWIWVGIGLLLMAAIGLVFWQAQRNVIPVIPGRRTVFTLQLGDIVQYGGTDWVVEGRLTFQESGYEWLEYMLQDGDRLTWLAVEEDDVVEIYWMEIVTDLELRGDPPRTLTYQGITYRQTQTGVALMTRTGTMRHQPPARCRYYDYAVSDSNQRLAIEMWDNDVEISVGLSIRSSALTLLPGDGRRVYGE
jgi:Domain of unknown function (DUF4178)